MTVTVYSTQTCPWCNVAKSYLKKNNIQFIEKDVGRDHEAAHEMVRKSGQMGVPVIEANGQIIVGFNEQAIKRALDA